jgi:hypothetical protein
MITLAFGMHPRHIKTHRICAVQPHLVPAYSSNAKFTPMPVLSISATLRASPGEFGRIILAHVASSCLVVNAKVVADPCLISKASRASRMTLVNCQKCEHRGLCGEPTSHRLQIQPLCLDRSRFSNLQMVFRTSHSLL